MATASAQVSIPNPCNASTLQGLSTTQATIVTETTTVYATEGAAVAAAFDARVIDALPTGDYTVEVHLQKSDGTVLTDTVTIDADSLLGVRYSAPFLVATLSAGDQVQVVIVAAGSMGTQAAGLEVTFSYNEAD